MILSKDFNAFGTARKQAVTMCYYYLDTPFADSSEPLGTLNFFLYGAAMSMSGINLHMTEDSYAGAWKPRTLDGTSQGIRPTYYAYAAMAQLIGSGNGTTQIARLSSDTVPAAYDDYVRYVLIFTIFFPRFFFGGGGGFPRTMSPSFIEAFPERDYLI